MSLSNTQGDPEWKKEIKKGRRGCIIRLNNTTTRILELRESKLTHGKWSSACIVGSLCSDNQQEWKNLVDVPPQHVPSQSFAEFGSVCKTVFTSTQGTIKYQFLSNSNDQPSSFSFSWNISKIGKEKTDLEFGGLIRVEKGSLNKFSEITLNIFEDSKPQKSVKEDIKKPKNYSGRPFLLTSSSEIQLPADELEYHKQDEMKQFSLLSSLSPQELTDELAALELASEQDPPDPTDLLSGFSKFVKFVQDNKLSQNQAPTNIDKILKTFMTKSLPTVLRTTLKRRFSNDKVRKNVNKFIRKVVDVIVDAMPGDDYIEGILDMLAWIFDKSQNFYDEDLYGSKKSAPVVGKYALSAPPTDFYVRAPGLVIANVNYFGEKGGFTAIIDRIQSNPPPSLKVLSKLLEPPVRVRRYLETTFLSEWIISVKDSVFGRILELSDQELKDEQSTSMINTIVENVENLLKVISSNAQTVEIVEKFRLDFAAKCLKSDSLQKRVKGINDLLGMLRKSARKETSFSTSLMDSPQWLTPDFLIEWFNQQKLLETVFEDKYMHPESVRRASGIYLFLAKQNAIETHHLSLLWQAALTASEDIVTEIHAIVTEICPFLTFKQLDYIHKKISQISLADYTHSTLALLRTVAVNSLVADLQNKKKYNGLHLFWKIITAGSEEPAIAPDIIQQAMHNFVKLIRYSEASSQRMLFIELCAENLVHAKMTDTVMVLLPKILATFPANTPNGENIASIVASLESKHCMMNNFFRDLVALANLPDDISERLSKRLDFLSFMLSGSGIVLSSENIDILWSFIISPQLPSFVKDVMFQWMETLCSKSNMSDPCLILYIFTQKLCTLDSQSFTEAAFSCFKRYFRAINKAQQSVDMQDTSLTGLAKLWSITLECLDEGVVSASVRLISKLYDKAAPQAAKQKAKVRQEYLDLLLANLSAGSSEKNTWKLHRSLRLIQSFLEEGEKQGSHKGVKVVTLKLYPLKGLGSDEDRHSYFYINAHATTTFRDLKRRVAHRMRDINPQVSSSRVTICLIDNNRSKETTKTLRSKDKDKTLKELKITDGQTLYYQVESLLKAQQGSVVESSSDSLQELEAIKNELPIPVSALNASAASLDADEDDTLTARFLFCSNPANTDLLFDLLATHSHCRDVCSVVWDILVLLPINRSILNQLLLPQSQSTLDWDKLLNSNSPYQLLYSLQIVESILNDSLEDKERMEWAIRFRHLGGFQHAYNVLFHQGSYIANFSDVQNQLIVATLLRIISFFMLEHSRESNEQDPSLRSYLVQPKSDDSFAWLDFAHMITNLLNIIWVAARVANNETGVTKVTQEAVALVGACLASNPSLVPAFCQFKDLSQFVVDTILETSSEITRQNMADAIYKLCTKGYSHIDPKAYFMPLFIDMLDNVSHYPNTCEQYFDGLVALLKHSNDAKEMKQVLGKVVQLFKERPVVEKHDNGEPDLVLLGLLDVVGAFVQMNEDMKAEIGQAHRMVEEVFLSLFQMPASTVSHDSLIPPRCKTKQSRNAAFRLLEELARSCPVNYATLLQLITCTHLNNKEGYEWNYSPSSEGRSIVGYVGLKNLGSTCYMNSLLQQLFMMPRFKEGIIRWQPQKSVSKAKHSMEHDELMLELQKLFLHLQDSMKQFYDTTSFAFAYKDFEGNPTNVLQQMDVDEFFNMLCERLDSALQQTSQAKLLSNIWSGEITTQLICKGCPHTSEKSDTFYTISLDIHGKLSIEEALEHYVAGEMLTGNNAYFCQECGCHRDTLKRTVINTLPSTLIVHLKRFTWNLDTMKKVKLNDFCAFPSKLNMHKYTKEFLSKDSSAAKRDKWWYEYELRGILVHSGTADAGHYYSFIKERLESNPRWIQFNDRYVSSFDPSLIEEECFGGTEILTKYSSSNKKIGTEEVPKSRSAYMLIYDRVQRNNSPLNSQLRPTHAHKPSEGTIQLQLKIDPQSNLTTFNDAVDAISDQPTSIYQAIWAENLKFIRDKTLLDTDYYCFLSNVLKIADEMPSTDHMTRLDQVPDPIVDSVQMGIYFLVKVIYHAKDRSAMPDFVKCLTKKFTSHIPACKWFLRFLAENNIPPHNLLTETLIQSPVLEVTNSFVDLILHALHTLLLLEEKVVVTDKMMDNSLIKINLEACTKTTSFFFIDTIFSMTLMNIPSKRLGNFFRLLQKFAQIGPIEKQFLVSKQLMSQVIKLFMETPVMDCTKHNFGKMVSLIHLLVCSASPNSKQKQPPPTDIKHSGPKLHIPPQEMDAVLSPPFLAKLMRRGINEQKVAKILVHLMWENELLSDSLTKLIVHEVCKTEMEDIRYLFQVVPHILKIDDQHKKRRMKTFITTLLDALYVKKDKEERKELGECRECIRWLRSLLTNDDCKHLREWLKNHESKWAWISKFLERTNNISFYNTRTTSYGSED